MKGFLKLYHNQYVYKNCLIFKRHRVNLQVQSFLLDVGSRFQSIHISDKDQQQPSKPIPLYHLLQHLLADAGC